MARIRAAAPPVRAAAETELVARYGPAIALLLDRHTNGRPEAEDLFQDTFSLVLKKLRAGELREPEKLPAFVAAIARSLAIEHYRKASRRKTEPDSEAVLAAPATARGQLGDLLASENAGLVRRVLAELRPERDREVLLRFYLAEEERDAIAADFGLSSLQFNRVLHRARQRYRELWTAHLARLAGTVAVIAVIAVAGALGAIGRLSVPLGWYGLKGRPWS